MTSTDVTRAGPRPLDAVVGEEYAREAPIGLVREASASAGGLVPSKLDAAFTRPLFVDRVEIKAFADDLVRVIELIERLPRMLGGVELAAFAEFVGMPRPVLPLLEGLSFPKLTCYGRADAYWSEGRFWLLELGLSTAVGGVNRAAVVPRQLLRHPGFAKLASRWSIGYDDPLDGLMETLATDAQPPRSVVLVEATGGLAEYGDIWSLFADRFRERGVAAELAEVGDLTRGGDGRVVVAGHAFDACVRLFMLPEVAAEPRPDALWAVVHPDGMLDDSRSPMTTAPEHDVYNSKACLALLHSPRVRDQLAPDELEVVDRIVPPTRLVDDADADEWLHECRERLVLKPATGARSEGSCAGWLLDPTDWAAAVAHARRSGGYVAQERVVPARIRAADPRDGALSDWQAVLSPHYGPSGLTGLTARVTPYDSRLIGMGSDVLFAPVVTCDKASEP